MFYIIAFFVLFFIFAGIVAIFKEDKERIEYTEWKRKWDEEFALDKLKRDKEITRAGNAAFLKFGEYFTGTTTIDSSVWMDFNCGNFFFLLEKYCVIRSVPLVFPEPQFHQFSKIKKIAEAADLERPRILLAFDRIERLHKSGLLGIVPAPFEKTDDAYTDAFMLPWMSKMALPGKMNTLFSGDKELRIRIWRNCSAITLEKWNVVEIDSIESLCGDFKRAWDVGLVNENTLSPLPRKDARETQ